MSCHIETSKKVGKKVAVLCHQCRIKTQHSILAAVDYRHDEEDTGIWLAGSAQIIQCQGCETVGFRDVAVFSENQGESEELYPPRPEKSLVDDLYLRDDLYDVPDIIQVIYRETLEAVQRNLPTLAGLGIRAVIEATCKHLKAKKRTLQDMIDELASMCLLTAAGAKILHSIRELGNYAAHEMKTPSKKQITAALKAIDHLLLGVYVLPEEAKVLPKPRKRRPKKKTTRGSGTGGTAP